MIPAAEVETFRERLMKLRDRLTGQVGRLEDDLREAVVATGDVSTVPTHPADFDAEGIDPDLEILQNQVGVVRQVDAALTRIQDGTFGRCERCGGDIDMERLNAVPYAARCMRCADAA